MNQKKHCFNCSKINNALNDAHSKLKERTNIVPPSIETYNNSKYNKRVHISPEHGKNEVIANERLACFLADNLDKDVFLLPRLDPSDPKKAPLRKFLLPSGVIENKNPDFLIGGLLFDGKSMMSIKKIEGVTLKDRNRKYHRDIQNRIKDAVKQADNVVLEIPTFVSRKSISKAVKGYLRLSSKDRFIIIKHGNKCYVYDKKYIK